MNILFLTLAEISDFNQTGIYPDLINEFADNGHNIYVVSPCEKKNKDRYKLIREKGNIHLISALIPDYYGMGFVKKGISSLAISGRYMSAIKKTFPNIIFDLILYSTPPITFCGVIEKIKKRDHAVSYLLLKDIWPQGPIDIEVLSTTGIKGIITKFFQRKEERLYSISDYIGCMSEKNCQYLFNKSGVDKAKIEVCPNSIKVRKPIDVDIEYVRSANELPLDKTIFVYGGNLGVAQGIDFILSCLQANEKNQDTFILIVGSGTEYNKICSWFDLNKPKNSKLIPHLPKNEYLQVMASCDVGLIFLDCRFTIPNFPSRLLSYMEAKMPVLAATDTSTDVGTVIEQGGFGYWCESSDVNKFTDLMNKIKNKDNCSHMGECAYQYLIDNYSVTRAYDIIMAHFQDEDNIGRNGI